MCGTLHVISVATCKCASAGSLKRMQLRNASSNQKAGLCHITLSTCHLAVESLSRPLDSGPVYVLGLQSWLTSQDSNQSTVNCEIEIALSVFISFSLSNIEVWMLFKLVPLMLAHLGCVFSCMYWFLIKAWWHCNGLFVFSSIKQFLSLVSKVCGCEWEIKALSG